MKECLLAFLGRQVFFRFRILQIVYYTESRFEKKDVFVERYTICKIYVQYILR